MGKGTYMGPWKQGDPPFLGGQGVIVPMNFGKKPAQNSKLPVTPSEKVVPPNPEKA